MKKRFTRTMLEALEPGPEGKPFVVWDTDIAGLGVRVARSRGKDKSTIRTLFIQFRVGRGDEAREIKMTLGPVGELVRDDAALQKVRDDAADLRQKGRTMGVDPREAKREEDKKKKAEEEKKKAAEETNPIFAAYVDVFLEAHAEGYADGGETARRELARAVAAFGTKRIKEVTTGDVEALLRKTEAAIRKTGKSGKATVNMTLTILSKLFSFAEKHRMIDRLPTRGIKRKPVEAREWVLDDEEVQRFFKSLDDYARTGRSSAGTTAADFADALRLLLTTGARRGEVLGMQWAGVDLAAGRWTRRAEQNKQRKKTTTLLSPVALSIIEGIRARREAGPEWARTSAFVFPSKLSSSGHMASLKHTFAEVRKAAKIDKPVVLHDLRATFVSTLIADGMPLPMVIKLTGHANTVTLAKHYARLQTEAPLLEGLSKMGARWGLTKPQADGEPSDQAVAT